MVANRPLTRRWAVTANHCVPWIGRFTVEGPFRTRLVARWHKWDTERGLSGFPHLFNDIRIEQDLS